MRRLLFHFARQPRTAKPSSFAGAAARVALPAHYHYRAPSAAFAPRRVPFHRHSSTQIAGLESDVERTFQQGLTHFKTGNPGHVQALVYFTEASLKGHVEAKVKLASMYLAGYGTKPNPNEAHRLLEEAGLAGNVEAQKRLGAMFNAGTGVTQNFAESAKWYLMASQQGDVKSQFNLGVMYLYGIGVARNKAEGLRWLTEAATSGNAESQNLCGVIHSETPGNESDAVYWFRQAAEQGDANAQFNLGELYKLKKVPDVHIKGNGYRFAQAATWLRRAADQGHVKAQSALGFLHYHGLGVPKDFGEAIKWLGASAELGVADSQLMMSVICTMGNPPKTPPNPDKAKQFMDQFVANNLPERIRPALPRLQSSPELAAKWLAAFELQTGAQWHGNVEQLMQWVPFPEIATPSNQPPQQSQLPQQPQPLDQTP